MVRKKGFGELGIDEDDGGGGAGRFGGLGQGNIFMRAFDGGNGRREIVRMTTASL